MGYQDANDTAREQGPEGVRARGDNAKKFDGAQSDLFTELLAKAQALAKGDDVGLKALIAEMLTAAFSNERCDMLLRAAAKASGFALMAVRKLVGQTELELTEKERNTPEVREAERRAKEAEAEAARMARKAEHELLWGSCSEIALSKSLLADMEALVHKLGVVGEGASIRGAYLAAVSRLLQRVAISYVRRGAAAGGKNHLVKMVLRLFPKDSIIEISSATPQALIYLGEDENDVNALKHKVIVIAEAAILARKANGDEHAMTGMLRILLSEGKLDHLIPVPQPGGTPKTVHVRRDGPVSLFITSAREDIEPEMLTRLLSSDADESGELTLKVVDNVLSLKRETVKEEEIERWCNLQRYLALNGPYEVLVPFSEAIAQAYRELTKAFPATLQLRMRRDVSALKAAIEASAIVHQAQRQRDAAGRIIAEIADYENAHAAFNEGAAALYDLKPSEAIVATLKAVAEIAREERGEDDEEDDEAGERSYKIVVEEVRRKLGVASKETASRRLGKVVDLGFLEEDEARRGKGRGSPRFYKIRNQALDGQMGQLANAFPAASEVKKICEGRGGSKTAVQNVRDVQEGEAAAADVVSCTSRSSCTAGLVPPLPKDDSSAASRTSCTTEAGAMPTPPEAVVAENPNPPICGRAPSEARQPRRP
jgi:PAS domain-containing protein